MQARRMDLVPTACGGGRHTAKQASKQASGGSARLGSARLRKRGSVQPTRDGPARFPIDKVGHESLEWKTQGFPTSAVLELAWWVLWFTELYWEPQRSGGSGWDLELQGVGRRR